MDIGHLYRKSFTWKIIKVLEELIQEGTISEDMFRAQRVLSVGGAFCEDVIGICDTFGPVPKIYAVDPAFAPYEGFGQRVAYIPRPIQKVSQADLGGPIELAEMSHVLQTCPNNCEKLEILKALRNLMDDDGYVIFVDEIRRDGWGGFYDRFLHYLYNNSGLGDLVAHLRDGSLWDGYYILQGVGDYERLFLQAGFEMMVSRLYFRGSFIAILRAVPQKV